MRHRRRLFLFAPFAVQFSSRSNCHKPPTDVEIDVETFDSFRPFDRLHRFQSPSVQLIAAGTRESRVLEQAVHSTPAERKTAIMLKITITDTPEEQKWTLQGQLTGTSVSELLSSWSNTRDARKGRRCMVDLDDVTFIDEEGESALDEMMREGVRTVARGVYTKQLLADIRSKNKRRMCRFFGRMFVLTFSVAALRSLLLASTLVYLYLAAASPLRAQTGASRGDSPPAASVSSILAPQSPYLGSVPDGKATDTAIPLSIRDAVERGLKFNLGLIQSDLNTLSSRSERLKNLSELLPDIHASLSQTVEQINLKSLGFNFNIPGINPVVGPFGVQDARVYLEQKFFDWNSVQKLRASTEELKASQFSYKDSREIVVLAVGNAYLQVISDAATVESQQAQVKTSEALRRKAADQREAGVAARIDELRAQVELQTQQQRLIAARNQLAKDKLNLARITGLPPGQDFKLTDTTPYAPLEGVTLQKALEDAYANRADYESAKALVRAAEHSRKAAAAERYPSLAADLSYGDIGPNFGGSHGTFAFAGVLNIPIFQGGRVKADILKAESVLRQRRAEAEELRARIDKEVRSAFLDLESAGNLVTVARSNIQLAGETLTQARDRFDAGVTDNIEVVQAQESVAAAEQAYISSLYTFNIAKVELARAAGIAGQSVIAYLGGK
jgi:outer membrane protein TolC